MNPKRRKLNHEELNKQLDCVYCDLSFRSRDLNYHMQITHETFCEPVKRDKRRKHTYSSIRTHLVDDQFGKRNEYWYNEKKDELWTLIPTGQELYLGSCKSAILKEGNLPEYISRFNGAIHDYDETNDSITELFRKMDDVRDKYEYNRETRSWKVGELFETFYEDLLPGKHRASNMISLLYFIIAKKTPKMESLKDLAARAIVRHKIKCNKLPKTLKTFIKNYKLI